MLQYIGRRFSSRVGRLVYGARGLSGVHPVEDERFREYLGIKRGIAESNEALQR